MEHFYGKYRGTVTNNEDPQNLGRIRAQVPDVLGQQETGWAMPCAPFGGSQTGLFVLPEKNAGVWIEFEGGDTEYPIWSGCWWGSQAEMPALLQNPPQTAYQKVILITTGGHQLILDDTSQGGLTLQTSGGAKIVMNDSGIEIDNGQGASIKMEGSTISLNDDALEVS